METEILVLAVPLDAHGAKKHPARTTLEVIKIQKKDALAFTFNPLSTNSRSPLLLPSSMLALQEN